MARVPRTRTRLRSWLLGWHSTVCWSSRKAWTSCFTSCVQKNSADSRFEMQELCVDDVCVTREEFLRMKEGQSAAAERKLA